MIRFKRQKEKKGGWTIDVDLLDDISENLNKNEGNVYLEDIEQVLLAMEKVGLRLEVYKENDND